MMRRCLLLALALAIVCIGSVSAVSNSVQSSSLSAASAPSAVAFVQTDDDDDVLNAVAEDAESEESGDDEDDSEDDESEAASAKRSLNHKAKGNKKAPAMAQEEDPAKAQKKEKALKRRIRQMSKMQKQARNRVQGQVVTPTTLHHGAEESETDHPAPVVSKKTKLAAAPEEPASGTTTTTGSDPAPTAPAPSAPAPTQPAAPAANTTVTPAAPAPTTDSNPAPTTPAPAPEVATPPATDAPIVAGNGTSLVTKVFEEIVKSRSDDRRYRRFRLENGLDALVVSDMTSTKSAAAMDVNVGYWADPPEVSGLAHFLEHMLFLGTKKHPEEDGYSSFLSSHGGSSNAFTSMQNTNYYFDIQPDALYGALDRFAQFFISPLMSESATEREVKAVESEHVKNLQSDAWRTFQLIQSFAREDHPFHKFGTGSSGTLGAVEKSKLREELLKFWKKHYIAKNMRLVIIGRHSLSTLEKWVRVIFADLPTGEEPAPHVPNPYPVVPAPDAVFKDNFLPSFVHLETVKNSRSLLLLWTLPPQVPSYSKKNMEYISTLLGGEAAGSLLSALKRRGWATALSAGPDLTTGSFDLFQVDIDLTRKGFKPEIIREVIALVYQYIRVIETTGVEEWRWHEMGTISAIHFRLKNKEVAMSYASSLAADMCKYQPRDLLMANYMYMKYDPEGIRSLLKYMQPSRMLALISAKKGHFVNLTLSEKWYGTKHFVQPISQADVTFFSDARFKPAAQPVVPPMTLPIKNKFIPKSLAIKPKHGIKKHVEHPTIIKDVVDKSSGSIRVWYKQDHMFRRPRANLVCKFWSKQLYSTPRDVVLSSLFTKVIRDTLQEETYPASVAGFEMSFSSDVDGFDLHISGYDSGLKTFVADVAKYFLMVPASTNGSQPERGFTPNVDRFNIIKDQLANSYKNFMFGQPHIHAAYSMSLLLEDPHWYISEYETALQDIELNDLIQWSHAVWKDVALECLVHGNLYRNEALSIVDAITDQVEFRSNHQALRTMSGQVQRVVELDGAYSFWKLAPNKHDRNSALYQYYQAGIGNYFEDTSTQLLSMVMDKPAFHQLRTVEQLGYIVWSGTDIREGVNGVRIIVQSPTRPANYLHKRVRHFVKKLRNDVRKLSARQFRTYVRTLMGIKLQSPRTMQEESAKYWYEISTQQYQFDRRFRELIALRFQSRKKFFRFVDRLFGWRRVPSMISMQIQSQKTLPSAQNPDAPANATASGSSGAASTTSKAAQRKSLKRGSSLIEQAEHLRRSAKVAFSALEESSAVSDEEETDREAETNPADLPLDIEEPSTPHHEGPRVTGLLEVTSTSDATESELIKCGGAAYDDPRCACASHVPNDNCNSWSVRRVSSLHSASAGETAPAESSDEDEKFDARSRARAAKAAAAVAAARKARAARRKKAEQRDVPQSDTVTRTKIKFALKNRERFHHWVSEIPCSKSGPRRWHKPVELTIESTNTFKSSMCLFPKRTVGAVILPSYAIVKGYPKKTTFRKKKSKKNVARAAAKRTQRKK